MQLHLLAFAGLGVLTCTTASAPSESTCPWAEALSYQKTIAAPSPTAVECTVKSPWSRFWYRVNGQSWPAGLSKLDEMLACPKETLERIREFSFEIALTDPKYATLPNVNVGLKVSLHLFDEDKEYHARQKMPHMPDDPEDFMRKLKKVLRRMTTLQYLHLQLPQDDQHVFLGDLQPLHRGFLKNGKNEAFDTVQHLSLGPGYNWLLKGFFPNIRSMTNPGAYATHFSPRLDAFTGATLHPPGFPKLVTFNVTTDWTGEKLDMVTRTLPRLEKLTMGGHLDDDLVVLLPVLARGKHLKELRLPAIGHAEARYLPRGSRRHGIQPPSMEQSEVELEATRMVQAALKDLKKLWIGRRKMKLERPGMF